ncbi:MAG: hypothetical protein J6Q65_02085, partial [Lentisphaeria bacterium]|nr:hypothetical protein [Lentisphaeria bacterium]
NKSNPEVIYWRSRMENEVAMFDSEFKLYDFRLGKSRAGEVESLSFHLLIPHKYGMTDDEIRDALKKRMQIYKEDLKLEILILKSYI